MKNFNKSVLYTALLSFVLLTSIQGEELQTKALPSEAKKSFQDQQNRKYIFSDPNYYTWCPSVIKDNGQYHMFYSRWKKSDGFLGWLRYCEVAHAVADKVEGPYRYVDTALKGRGLNSGAWDSITAHNPKIKKFGKKYYLYYISTNGIKDSDTLRSCNSYGHPKWKILRNNQRTGVAVSKTINGPWKRFDKALVEPTAPFANITVNPAITRGHDGRFYLVIKGDKPGSRQRIQAIASSQRPTGPFVFEKKAIKDDIDTEDCSIFYDKVQKAYFVTFHAHKYIGLITSKDAKNWQKATPYKIHPSKNIHFSDGSKIHIDRLERPFIFTNHKGQASHLFLAAKKGNHSVIITLPIKVKLASNDDL